jgi:KUP system potassium uptake protein
MNDRISALRSATATEDLSSGGTDAAAFPYPGHAMSLEPGQPKPLRAGLVLAALGVVFGDIGTSPLYTLQECLGPSRGVPADPANVFGVVSLICWAVTFVVTVKYLGFLMRADNHGEGGIMALLALVPEKLVPNRPGRVGLVAALVIVGAALLFGDGIITPAISVLSAVEGLEVATTSLKPIVIPATVVILFALFLAQRRGTGRLGTYFGPVMTVWFVSIAALGVSHILRRPSILWALSPHHGIAFFLRHGWEGLRVLGGVVLAVTGGEALYADMGHFGRPPIRVAWLGLIYPALLLCYLGQGATLLDHPEAAGQPFFAMVGGGPLIYPLVGIATAATVIASQALISGVFSMTHQAIRLGYFPRLTVLHTSGEAEGQIYLPLMNWGLAIACIALVLIFRESSRLAAAFGLAVSGTMLITSLVYYTVVRHAWGWSFAKSAAILGFFLCFDIPFVIANALKFLDGGYLPFCVGAFFVVIMVVWRIGRSLVREYFAEHSRPVGEFLSEVAGECPARAPGTAVFLSSQQTGIPATLARVMERFRIVHEHTVILTVSTEHVPHVPAEQRVNVSSLSPGLDRVVLRFGFMDAPDVPAAMDAPLATVGAGPSAEAIYVIGRETYVGTSRNKMGAVSESIFDVMSRNARKPTDDFCIPPEQVMEIGTYIDL